MKTTVKYWWGKYTDSAKAQRKEFPTKKAAKAWIKSAREFHAKHGHEMHGASHFYEIE